MKERALCLLRQMREELERLRENGQDPLSVADHCFRICIKYQGMLANELSGYLFLTLEEEIEFYKLIRPLFSAESEYYTLLYMAEMFNPAELEPRSQRAFWKRERNRFKRYIEANKELYQYFKQEKTEKDIFYFVRNKDEQADDFQFPVSYKGGMTTARVDRVIANFIALERYQLFAEEQLQLISNDL